MGWGLYMAGLRNVTDGLGTARFGAVWCGAVAGKTSGAEGRSVVVGPCMMLVGVVSATHIFLRTARTA